MFQQREVVLVLVVMVGGVCVGVFVLVLEILEFHQCRLLS